MKYNGVDVNNPRIVEYIKSAAKQGKTKQEVMKLVGMPYEVVDKYFQEAKREKNR